LPLTFDMECEAAGCDPQIDCSQANNCDTCTSEGCKWCLDSSECNLAANTSCVDYIINNKFCPGPHCSQFTDCQDCTTSSQNCGWCLDTQMCIPATPVPPPCPDFVRKSTFCNLSQHPSAKVQRVHVH
jgi:hypothetical protein